MSVTFHDQRNRPRYWLVGSLMACGLLAPAAGAHATETQVMIDNFTFSPPEVTVPVGATVSWTNRDDIPHAVTDADQPKAIRSPPLDTGEGYRRTFAAPGTYHYFCSLHPHMQGTIIVQ